MNFSESRANTEELQPPPEMRFFFENVQHESCTFCKEHTPPRSSREVDGSFRASRQWKSTEVLLSPTGMRESRLEEKSGGKEGPLPAVNTGRCQRD